MVKQNKKTLHILNSLSDYNYCKMTVLTWKVHQLTVVTDYVNVNFVVIPEKEAKITKAVERVLQFALVAKPVSRQRALILYKSNKCKKNHMLHLSHVTALFFTAQLQIPHGHRHFWRFVWFCLGALLDRLHRLVRCLVDEELCCCDESSVDVEGSPADKTQSERQNVDEFLVH